jgi:alpha-L-rhamnosidase
LAHRLKGDDATRWETEAAALAERFVSTYIAEDGTSRVASQTAISMLLSAELYRDREVLAAQLARTVEADNFQLTCGMVGVQYIYDALHASGHPDYAYRLLAESNPGYKTWFEAGATTLWERWDGYDKGSHNHHMYSNVLGWLFKALLGISPDEHAPGFTEIELKPAFIAEIGFVRGWMETVRGKIETEWQYEDGAFLYKVTIPEGIKATFRGELLSAGENQFRIGEET